MKSWKAKSLLLFGTSIWGATFLFTQIGIKYCSPTLYLIIRFTIALVLSFLFFGKHITKATKQTVKRGGLLGIFFAGGFLLQTFGLKYTTINNTAFITNFGVIMTPFIYWFISREKVKTTAKISVIIAFVGLYILANPSIDSINFGDLLVFFSTFFWALYISYLHVFTKNTDDFALNAQLIASQFAVGLPLLIIYFFAFEASNAYFIWDTSLLVSLAFNSIAASFVVSFIQISVQKHTTPVNAALIFAMEPIFASIISFAALGEVLTARGYIGAAMMMIAVFVGDTFESILVRMKATKNKL